MDKSRDRTYRTSEKRDSSGLLKTPASDLSYAIPFGPHLIPINCEVHLSQKPRCTCSKNTDKDPAHLKCEGELGCDGERHESSGQAGSSGTSDGPDDAVHISTNDMLECLVHPDVIALMSRLLMHRQKELHHY